MRDYLKTCWNCESTDLDHSQGFIICRNCAATWNPVIQPERISHDYTDGQMATREAVHDGFRQEKRDARRLGKSGSLTQTTQGDPP